MSVLLVTVDSLRRDHFDAMPATREFLDAIHDRAFATSTATMGSFPAVVGGEYPREVGLIEGSSVASRLPGHRVGITTNHLLSPRYGYDEGFDSFESPAGGGDTIKDRVAAWLERGSLPYRVASRGYGLVQRLAATTGDEVEKSFRRAADVIDSFLTAVADRAEWFGWLHFMEPHHPYDPDDAPVDRVTAQQLTRRVLAGDATPSEAETVRELYRLEIERLDAALADLWAAVPDDTRVVFAADHGEFLGENGRWGHPGVMAPELLHVPFGTRNAPSLGEVVSLVDVPSILRGEPHGEGILDREVAYATYGDATAAMSAAHVATGDGVFALTDGSPAENPSLARRRDRFDPGGVVKSDAVREDLEELGYV